MRIRVMVSFGGMLWLRIALDHLLDCDISSDVCPIQLLADCLFVEHSLSCHLLRALLLSRRNVAVTIAAVLVVILLYVNCKLCFLDQKFITNADTRCSCLFKCSL